MTTSVRAEILLSLKDSLSGPAAKAGQSVKGLSGDIKQGFGSAIQTLTGFNVASLGVAGAIGGLAAGIKYAVDQAAEAERIFSITEAVVKSTGGAAGLTAEQISNMAGRLSQLNAVDDEVILSAQNVLLTFKKIKGEAFEQASQAALDLSVVMGGDLRSSMLMIGKALEDPIRGITALRRAGVSFTEDQRALIKELVNTGRQAEAMNIILTEVNTQVGGAGAAAAGTYAGQLDLLRINVDNLAQSLGEGLIPPLTDALAGLNLLITHNEKVTAALDEHREEVLNTAGSYEEYITELERSAIASRLYFRAGDGVVRMHGDSLKILPVLTEAEFNRAQAIANSTHETSEAERVQGRMMNALIISTTATSDAAHGYAAMGEAANAGMGEAVTAIEEAQAAMDKFNNSILQQAVDAGMDGTLTKAWDEYQSVLAETQPEIDKLRADIERMNAAQGQTFTVTTAATTSIEEYELAQIKAATAAQKLAEHNGENREEWLELKIAADEAAQKVGALGEEMGLTQTFTADYTKKLMEANGSLSELEAKQAAAQEALRRTTAEFVFQQLAIEGDAAANLELARNLGLLDEATYQASLALLHLKTQYEDGALSAENYGKMSGLAADAIARLQDKNVTITFTTVYEEIHRQQIQDATMDAGGQGGGVSDGIYDPKPGQAMGGPIMGGKSYIVGEQGPELFTSATSGTITPNHQLGGGVTIENINITIPGGDARAISQQLAAELRRALSNGGAYLGA